MHLFFETEKILVMYVMNVSRLAIGREEVWFGRPSFREKKSDLDIRETKRVLDIVTVAVLRFYRPIFQYSFLCLLLYFLTLFPILSFR